MTRRLIALVVACAWIAGCGGRASGPANPIPQLPAAPQAPSRDGNVNELPEPPVVHAVNGVAKFSLIANVDPATGLPSFQYNYQHGVAPTIDINPGESFEIELTDNLPASTGMASYANLHFHGLTVSPGGHSDNVLGLLAKPGQKLHYVVHVPKNQGPGLYWYHMHVHGETSYQVGEGGMSGAIVIEGLTRHLPELAKMKQRLIIVRATGIGQNLPVRDDDMSGMSDMSGRPDSPVRPQFSNTQPCTFKDGLTVTLNGAYRPVITIAPGEAVLPRRQCDRSQNAAPQGRRRKGRSRRDRRFRARLIPRYAADAHAVRRDHSSGGTCRVRRHRTGERASQVPHALLQYRA